MLREVSMWGGALTGEGNLGLTAFPSSNSAGDMGPGGGSLPPGVPHSTQNRGKHGEGGYTHRVPPWLEGQGFAILPPGDCGLWVAPGRPTLQNHLLAHCGHCILRLGQEILPKVCGHDGGSAGRSVQCSPPQRPGLRASYYTRPIRLYPPFHCLVFTLQSPSPQCSPARPSLTDGPPDILTSGIGPQACATLGLPSQALPAADSRAALLTAVPSRLLASQV